MPSQKEDVTLEFRTLEGELISSRVEHRIVYRVAGKPPSINSLGARRPLTSDNPPVVVIKPLSAPFDGSFETQIGSKLRALSPGTEVRVIGMFE